MSDDQLYRHSWRCRACAHRFHTVRKTADPSGMNPRCPKCKGKTKESFVEDRGFDPAAGKAPAVVGANVQVKAYDMALDICAQDQQLGDIQTHRYEGENTAPKLPSHLQKMADGFWGGQQQKTKQMSVDLSPIYGNRAQQSLPGQRFVADRGAPIEPILKSKPEGSSPVPPHTIIAG